MSRAAKRIVENAESDLPEEDAQDDRPPSKSEMKRRMLALQELGEQLVALSTDTLKKIDLPEDLRAAVLDMKRIAPSKYGGQRRQMQYIGRLMREIEAAPIAAQLEALKAPGRKATAHMHLAERWRERLLSDTTALAAFAKEYPEADQGELTRFIAAAHAERAARQPPKHFRLIFQRVHDLLKAGEDA